MRIDGNKPSTPEKPRPTSRICSEPDFVSAAFLEAYDLKIAGSPAEVQDRDARKKIVSLKFLIKALYEIRYEAEFRPAWIGLPVRGVLNLLDHMSNK